MQKLEISGVTIEGKAAAQFRQGIKSISVNIYMNPEIKSLEATDYFYYNFFELSKAPFGSALPPTQDFETIIRILKEASSEDTSGENKSDRSKMLRLPSSKKERNRRGKMADSSASEDFCK